jgi:uncharacterized membrane protein YphA (DoxX/SURF4 family)
MSERKLPALDPAIVVVILRIGLGMLFVWVFFENFGKNLYAADNYADLIRSYIQRGRAPAAWKQVMEITAANAAIAGPMQGMLEASLGVMLLLGLFARPAALVAFGFLTGLWVSEWGIGWIWELLMPMIVAAGLALGPSGRRLAIDVALARRYPGLPLW